MNQSFATTLDKDLRLTSNSGFNDWRRNMTNITDIQGLTEDAGLITTDAVWDAVNKTAAIRLKRVKAFALCK
jgi:hypothetical protein